MQRRVFLGNAGRLANAFGDGSKNEATEKLDEPPPPSFGLELEFFLLDDDDFPALGATERVIERWHHHGLGPSIVPELASFQIELNPGPWPLTPDGLETALSQCEGLVRRLSDCASHERVRLSPLGFVPKITTDYLCDVGYFTNDPKLSASARHFKNRHASVEFEDGSQITFPGESVVGCLNQIHIHVRQATDQCTLRYFNYLNRARDVLWAKFRKPLILNGKRARPECDTMQLFTQSNGEMNIAGDLPRICYLPMEISSAEQYLQLAASFAPIAVDATTTVPAERAIWFWVRLQGTLGSLRTEYRPMEMGPDWQSRARCLFENAYRFSMLSEDEQSCILLHADSAAASSGRHLTQTPA